MGDWLKSADQGNLFVVFSVINHYGDEVMKVYATGQAEG